MRPDSVAHFWSRVDWSGGPTACWPWTGPAYVATGYGQATNIHDLPGASTSDSTVAHRLAWIITNGDPGTHVAPSGKVVVNRIRHRCPGGPNRLCCNPAHLAIGTDKANADDRLADGNTFRGEQVAISVLTEAAVVAALEAHAAGATVAALARRHGVHRMTMSAAIHGDTWTHVRPDLPRPSRPSGRRRHRPRRLGSRTRRLSQRRFRARRPPCERSASASARPPATRSCTSTRTAS